MISHPTRSALHRRYPPHCIYHFLTDSSEQLQSFLKIWNTRTVRNNQVSVIFILLATKRSFKTLFSFKSNKKDHFQMPASYPGEGLLRKNSSNVSGYKLSLCNSLENFSRRHAIIGATSPKCRSLFILQTHYVLPGQPSSSLNNLFLYSHLGTGCRKSSSLLLT